MHYGLKLFFVTEDLKVYNEVRDLLLKLELISIGADKDFVLAPEKLPTIDSETSEEIPPEGPFQIECYLKTLEDKDASLANKDAFDTLFSTIDTYCKTSASKCRLEKLINRHGTDRNDPCTSVSVLSIGIAAEVG